MLLQLLVELTERSTRHTETHRLIKVASCRTKVLLLNQYASACHLEFAVVGRKAQRLVVVVAERGEVLLFLF